MGDWKMNGKPALLILHMQNGFAKHHRELWEKSGIITKQQALLKAFRSKSLPVIYINVMLNPPVAGKQPVYGLIWEQNIGTTNDPKDLEIIPELSPEPGDSVLINWPTGAFNNSGLDRTLRLNRVETIVVTGFSTTGVVYSTMQGAADRYYSTIIPKDATIAASPKGYEVFIDLIAPALSLVTTTEDLIAHLPTD